MSVSHFGLSVSDLYAAEDFYLAALGPLGYKSFGRQGRSVGLGVHDADFFLTQADGRRAAPTHVAFNARDRSEVRQCYGAALQAGGRPDGPPAYRNDDCRCYNAAVIDEDGHTIEFIVRSNTSPLTVTSGHSLTSPRDQHQDYRDVESVARRMPTRSRTSHALDLADDSPRQMVLQRSYTDPVEGFSSKAIIGTMLGAAAGAAFAYAMVKSERRGSREDNQYSAISVRGRGDDTGNGTRRRSVSSAMPHRNYSTTDSMRGPPPSLSARTRRAIDARAHRDDSDDDIFSFHRRRTTHETGDRTRTREELEYGPSRFTTRRAITMPVEDSRDQLLLEGPRSSRYGSRRSSVAGSKTSRHDSVISRSSSHRRDDRSKRSSTSQVSTVKPIKRSSQYENAADVPLPPSIVASRSGVKSSASKREPLTYYLDDEPEVDDDGLDTRTLVPEDSISCVGLPSSSRHRGERSMRSDMAIRPKEERSVLRSARDRAYVVRGAYSAIH